MSGSDILALRFHTGSWKYVSDGEVPMHIVILNFLKHSAHTGFSEY